MFLIIFTILDDLNCNNLFVLFQRYRTVSENSASPGGASQSSSSATVRKTRAETSRRHSASSKKDEALAGMSRVPRVNFYFSHL